MIDFLLEIGFEEFPPALLKRTAEDLSAKVEKLLIDERIFYRSIRVIYTSRRFGALVLGLTRKQKPQIIEIQGPPKKLAFDSEDKPTKMLQGFMKANNLKLTQIFTKKIKKGEYACGKKEIAGANTDDILGKEIPEIIRGLEFPKTMVWTKGGIRFPRPVRWIVALLDRRPLRFTFAGIKADRYSSPNQHFSFTPIRLEKPREYLILLRHGGVIADSNERRRIILKRIKQAAAKIGGKPLYTEEMIEEINCTIEYPEVVTGEFENQYLDLPEEVLMAVLKVQGDLIWVKGSNKFICIFNGKKKAVQNVRKGYTRGMAAKLYDAYFYYKNDLKQGLQNMLAQTKKMMWLEDLGSLYDKATRINRLVEMFKTVPELGIDALKRSAMLCKADLLSQMVREKDFTFLQGIMGGHYAEACGEDKQVAAAIKEHYLPKFVGDTMPKTKEGSVLSVVDKIDNVVGAFLSGNRPSGSYDPFGVRRNGYAVVSVIDACSMNISLFEIIDNLLKLYNKDFDKNMISEFFIERFTRYLQDKKFRYDEINAVLAMWKGDVTDVRIRCEALKKLRGKPDFTKLVIGQKRVRNILKDIKKIGVVNGELLKEDAEKKLYKKGLETKSKIKELFQRRDYFKILNLLLAMRVDIDKFFDDVMVMCDDKILRNNRLALVHYINSLFSQYADLSQIVIEGENQQE